MSPKDILSMVATVAVVLMVGWHIYTMRKETKKVLDRVKTDHEFDRILESGRLDDVE